MPLLRDYFDSTSVTSILPVAVVGKCFKPILNSQLTWKSTSVFLLNELTMQRVLSLPPEIMLRRQIFASANPCIKIFRFPCFPLLPVVARKLLDCLENTPGLLKIVAQPCWASLLSTGVVASWFVVVERRASFFVNSF